MGFAEVMNDAPTWFLPLHEGVEGTGGTARVAAITLSLVSIAGLLVLGAIFLSTRRGRDDGGAPTSLVERLKRGEKWWAYIAIGGLVLLAGFTIQGIPWFNKADPDTTVKVEAVQFGFLLDPPQVQVDQNVEFEMTSTDVSHGFGLYDTHEKLVLNVQIPPGTTTRQVYRPKHVGEYTIRCMEFCGSLHARMVGRLEVTE